MTFFLTLSIIITTFSYGTKYPNFGYSIFVFLSVPIFLFFWLIDRVLFICYGDKLNIIIIFDIDLENKGLVNIYKGVITNFKQKINDYNLHKRIRVVEKPLDFSQRNDPWAEKKVGTLGLPRSNLIIRGTPITAIGKCKFKLRFSYEFGHPAKESPELYEKIIKKEIDKGLFGMDLTIPFRSPSSIEAFAENIFEGSFYILGLTLFTGRQTNKQLDQNLEIFDIVVKEYQRANLIRQKEMRPMINTINECSKHILYFKLRNLLFEYKDRQKEIKICAQKILEIDKYDYSGLIAMAVIKELEGLRDDSKEYNRRAAINASKKFHAHELNNAYYSLCEGNYSVALEILNKLKQADLNVSFNFARNFLYDKHEETNNPALLFEVGFINLVWMGEDKLGRQELEEFIETTKDKEEFQLLISEAEELLKSD